MRNKIFPIIFTGAIGVFRLCEPTKTNFIELISATTTQKLNMDLISQITSCDLFTRLTKTLLAAEYIDFQTIDDSGGDAGNDGYSESEEILFQIYCPEKPEKADGSVYKAKIGKDLDKAKKLASSDKYKIRDWVFVTPRELTESVQTYLRTEAISRGMNGVAWSGTTLAGLLTKHPHLRSQFPELISPDIEKQIGNALEHLDSTKEDICTHINKKHDISTIDEEARQFKPTFTIKTHNNAQNLEIHIKIENGNSLISELSIDYPIWGIVSDIIDYNSSVDADTKKMLVTGNDTKNALNDIEILTANVKPNTIIEYKARYSKNDLVPQDINLNCSYFDEFISKYKLSFTWNYKGGIYCESEWRWMENNEITTKPPNEWKGIHIEEITSQNQITADKDQIPRRSFLQQK
jgi:hypothetical protein